MPGIEMLCQLNPLTAYQFDAAVTTFGTIIKNALQETVETGIGSSKRRVAKYKIGDLLDDSFQFHEENTLSIFQGVEGYDEVG